MSSGKIWPYILGGAITLVFGFCVATIVVTGKADIQPSDSYMTHYQDADANANKLIKAALAFDTKYTIEYIPKTLASKEATVSFEVKDKNGKSIENATIILAVSRPETGKFNKTFKGPKESKGVYTFSELEFPKAGVWNLVTKVSIGKDYKFYNIKADTRNANSYEF